MLAASRDTLRQKVEGYELRPGELCNHSLMCARASQLLAEQSCREDREVAFVGGLLHDVGKLVLGPYLSERLPAIHACMAEEGCSFVEAKKAVVGFDHAEIGGRIALHWNLPSPLVNAISLHHNPVQKECVTPLAAMVYLGNLICRSLSDDQFAESLTGEVNCRVLEVLGLKGHQVSAIMQNLREQSDKISMLAVD